jgi:acetylornithine deacetylase/succinyl-diaminopimelate desuccinylase-like protein
MPVRDNAIYAMSDALAKIRDLEFPLQLNDTTRAFFAGSGKSRGGALGQAMVAITANPQDRAAEALLNEDRSFHSMLRTTCVATLIDGGHALNALPQTVSANVNCRMFPGRTSAETQAVLAAAIGNPAITIKPKIETKPIAQVPPLDPRIMRPAEALVARYHPGVPLVPTMSTGATDGVYLGAAGIPTYGVPGGWGNPDGNGMHGLNERMEVSALYSARDFLFDYVKLLAGGK